jgi:hypothetical protein
MVAVGSQTRMMFCLMTVEIPEAERGHSIVGAFFTVDKSYRFIDFPSAAA